MNTHTNLGYRTPISAMNRIKAPVSLALATATALAGCTRGVQSGGGTPGTRPSEDAINILATAANGAEFIDSNNGRIMKPEQGRRFNLCVIGAERDAASVQYLDNYVIPTLNQAISANGNQIVHKPEGNIPAPQSGSTQDIQETVKKAIESGCDITMALAPSSDFPAYEPTYIPGNMGYVFSAKGLNNNVIRTNVIIGTDENISHTERNHLVREELTQGVTGLLNDITDEQGKTAPNSTFYQGWTDTQEYSPEDLQAIRMQMDPRFKPGTELSEMLAVVNSRDYTLPEPVAQQPASTATTSISQPATAQPATTSTTAQAQPVQQKVPTNPATARPPRTIGELWNRFRGYDYSPIGRDSINGARNVTSRLEQGIDKLPNNLQELDSGASTTTAQPSQNAQTFGRQLAQNNGVPQTCATQFQNDPASVNACLEAFTNNRPQ